MTAQTHTPRRDWQAIDAWKVAVECSTGYVVHLVQDAQYDIADLLAQRDELLEALEAITPYAEDITDSGLQAIRLANAAIAKARGDA